MAYRILFIIIISGYPIAFTGTQTNTPTPENSGSEFPTLQVTGVQNLAATPPENKPDEVQKDEGTLSESQVATVKRVQELLQTKNRTVLIKSIAICMVGGMTMLAIGRLK